MDRRLFLQGSAVVSAVSAQPAVALAANCAEQSQEILTPRPDGLNPPGIRTAGIRMIPVAGGKYKVWTKQVGSGSVKVLLLHGGPGFTHDYLEVMESFLPQAGIQMFYYDQLGVGNSDVPDDASLWTLPRYVEEVEEVRRGLGLDQFVLLGHSWGGMLAIDYALKYQHHLKGLVISNMCAGMQAYVKGVTAIKLTLPPAKLAKLNALEANEDYDSPEYDKIMMEDLYPKMICRIQPWPEPLTRAFRIANKKIYNQMQGKSEFVVTGNLKDWERWDRLHEIKTAALTMGAKFDSMVPADMQKMATLMPNANSAICPNGSHLAMYDDQEIYFRQLLGFLRRMRKS
jgi:proline iminopeptidase